ncbi:reverse transcriptase domain-containing protein [Streptomyces sp. NPDC096311]|uniref:reverse transcriptase domain-containing protein n=1 Tax=Streptomyces sp. NPDC096311 TaxID=3366083 RepID=UPI00382A46C2
MNSDAPSVSWPSFFAAERRVLDHQLKLHRWARAEPGVDAVTRHHVEDYGVIPFLDELPSSLKDGSVSALPVKQAVIPKKGGRVRHLGIPTLRDRVAQMALKLVLEPNFEVDFYPSRYGYRPGRRAQDVIAEIHHLTSLTYEWVVEGDITACFGRPCVCSVRFCGLVSSNCTAVARTA